jgi:SAM-dependent methyltransferase
MLNRHIDVRAYNREAWNHQVDSGNEWTVPVSPETVAAAREGRWQVLLTPTIPVPREWFPAMPGADVLCLACGGGQQGPIFAATGANVTVFDNSPRQLAQDRLVAEREGLTIRTVEGDMADLSVFADGGILPAAAFDLVFHPVSNVFAEDVLPVWREAYRVLRPGGVLLAGFMNPAIYIFDFALADEKGIVEVAHSLPYSDLADMSDDQLARYLAERSPLEFSHSLDEQIGGQLAAGFLLAGLFEDRYPPEQNDAISRVIPVFIATRAIKPMVQPQI